MYEIQFNLYLHTQKIKASKSINYVAANHRIVCLHVANSLQIYNDDNDNNYINSSSDDHNDDDNNKSSGNDSSRTKNDGNHTKINHTIGSDNNYDYDDDNSHEYDFIFDSFRYFSILFMKFRYYIINHHHHEGLGSDIDRKKVEVETAEEVLRINNCLKLNGDKSNNDDEVSDSWNGDDDNDSDSER